MNEKAIKTIEGMLENFKTMRFSVSDTPDYEAQLIDYNATKIEGYIDFAYDLDLITRDEHRHYYGKLLRIRANRLFPNT